MAPASVTLRLERVNASPRIRLEPVGVSRDATAWPGRPERVGFRGATRLCRAGPNVEGFGGPFRGPRFSWRGLEERHGFAGTLRRLGGVGGHIGAPHVYRQAATRAAPRSAAFGFSATKTGMVSISEESRPLSRKAATNEPALSAGRIRGAIPPATITPPTARALRARLPASAP